MQPIRWSRARARRRTRDMMSSAERLSANPRTLPRRLVSGSVLVSVLSTETDANELSAFDALFQRSLSEYLEKDDLRTLGMSTIRLGGVPGGQTRLVAE